MRLVALLLFVLLLSGCGKSEPTLAGGMTVSYWVQALKDPDAKLRKKAAFKLGNVGATEATALPALIQALQDVDVRVRCEVILAIVKFGPDAKEALPALRDVQKHDHDPTVRAHASKALDALTESSMVKAITSRRLEAEGRTAGIKPAAR